MKMFLGSIIGAGVTMVVTAIVRLCVKADKLERKLDTIVDNCDANFKMAEENFTRAEEKILEIESKLDK